MVQSMSHIPVTEDEGFKYVARSRPLLSASVAALPLETSATIKDFEETMKFEEAVTFRPESPSARRMRMLRAVSNATLVQFCTGYKSKNLNYFFYYFRNTYSSDRLHLLLF